MTTVAQMIEWMKTLPQDAEVECGVEVTNSYSTYMTMGPVDINDCSVIDFTSDENRVKYPKMAGKVFINIRGE
jgi:hypothetical protein